MKDFLLHVPVRVNKTASTAYFYFRDPKGAKRGGRAKLWGPAGPSKSKIVGKPAHLPSEPNGYGNI